MQYRRAGIVLLAALVAAACSASAGAGHRGVDSSRAAALEAAAGFDGSYDQIERLRAGVSAVDTSYERIEQLRGERGAAGSSSGSPAPKRVPPKGLR